MTKWLFRLRGALGLGLAWAAGWALAGVLVGVSSILLPFLPWDTFFRVWDAPLPALAMPGFIGGMLFSVILGSFGRRHQFHELSLPRVAVWGAAGGLALSLVPAVMVGLGLATLRPGLRVWELTAVIAGPLTLLGAASAAASLALARRAERRAALEPGHSAVEPALAEGSPHVRLEQRKPERSRGTT